MKFLLFTALACAVTLFFVLDLAHRSDSSVPAAPLQAAPVSGLGVLCRPGDITRVSQLGFLAAPVEMASELPARSAPPPASPEPVRSASAPPARAEEEVRVALVLQKELSPQPPDATNMEPLLVPPPVKTDGPATPEPVEGLGRSLVVRSQPAPEVSVAQGTVAAEGVDRTSVLTKEGRLAGAVLSRPSANPSMDASDRRP